MVLSIVFNNCGKVDVTNIDQKATGLPGANGNGDTGGLEPLGDPQDLISTCQQAKALGKIRVARLTGSFPDPKVQCDWGINGNLSQVNGVVRARTQQVQNLQVGNQATICNIKMESTLVSTFYYDDNVILTLNGFILASTTNFSRHFKSTRGYSLFDWTKLIGKPAQNGAADTSSENQYCAGKSEGVSACQFPKTETNGTAQLAFGESVIQEILGMTNSKNVTLGLITTGDDDATDCQHVPIDLNLDIEYIEP